MRVFGKLIEVASAGIPLDELGATKVKLDVAIIGGAVVQSVAPGSVRRSLPLRESGAKGSSRRRKRRC